MINTEKELLQFVDNCFENYSYFSSIKNKNEENILLIPKRIENNIKKYYSLCITYLSLIEDYEKNIIMEKINILIEKINTLNKNISKINLNNINNKIKILKIIEQMCKYEKLLYDVTHRSYKYVSSLT